jgi:hypothetical protein
MKCYSDAFVEGRGKEFTESHVYERVSSAIPAYDTKFIAGTKYIQGFGPLNTSGPFPRKRWLKLTEADVLLTAGGEARHDTINTINFLTGRLSGPGGYPDRALDDVFPFDDGSGTNYTAWDYNFYGPPRGHPGWQFEKFALLHSVLGGGDAVNETTSLYSIPPPLGRYYSATLTDFNPFTDNRALALSAMNRYDFDDIQWNRGVTSSYNERFPVAFEDVYWNDEPQYDGLPRDTGIQNTQGIATDVVAGHEILSRSGWELVGTQSGSSRNGELSVACSKGMFRSCAHYIIVSVTLGTTPQQTPSGPTLYYNHSLVAEADGTITVPVEVPFPILDIDWPGGVEEGDFVGRYCIVILGITWEDYKNRWGIT